MGVTVGGYEMPKKLTYEYVKSEFEKRGYKLLEKEYINNRTKMRYECPNHPDKQLSINYNNLQTGHGCPFCVGLAKKTLEEAKLEFEKRGYELLENEYKNNQTKMRYRCPRHPDKETYITLGHLISGKRCSYCSRKAKPSLRKVKREFERYGYQLLDEEYVSNKTKMRYRCPNHPEHQTFISLNELRRGRKCVHCYLENNGGENSPTWKGGLTSLKKYLRSLLKEWKFNSLEKYDFKCIITGENDGDLEVHHPMPFYKLRNEAFKNTDIDVKSTIGEYSKQELKTLSEELKKMHFKYEGVPMKKEVHKLFHRIYGHNVTIEDVYDFKARYNAGEFEDKKNKQDQQLELIL